MNHIPRLWVVLPLLVLAACTFAPEEEYFKPVDRPDPVVSIELNDYLGADTIFVYGRSRLGYSIDRDKGILRNVQILIDDDVIYSGEMVNGAFDIDHYLLRTGIFELKIQILVSSGTGSLADKENAENYLVWKKWILKIDVEPPPAPSLRFSVVNGFLRVDWDAYTKQNFVRYVLHRRAWGQDRYVARIAPGENFWVDSVYTGTQGDVQYELYVENTVTSSHVEKIYTGPAFTLQAKLNNLDSTVALKWNSTAFYGAFKKYDIRAEGSDVLGSTLNVKDTTLTVKVKTLVFGAPANIAFSVDSKYEDISQQWFRPVASAVVELGNKTYKGFSQVRYNSVLGRLAYSDGAYLYTFDNTLKPVDSLQFASFINIPFQGGLGYYEATSQIGTVDLKTGAIHTIPKSGDTYLSGFGGGLVKTSSRKWIVDKTYFNATLYDVATQTSIFSITNINTWYPTIHLSSDGKFIYTSQGEVRSVASGTTQLIGNPNFSGTFLGFREDKPDEMMLQNAGTIMVYSANDLSLLRVLPFPEVNYYSAEAYDPVTHNILLFSSQSRKVYTLNVDDGKTKSFNAYAPNPNQWSLQNGILFSENGQYLKIF
ncbi:hypothetical protein [Chryseolinea lacunae]|uniref:Fibronectin type-III domain-containing protein n=1 Tax=Chryseolinea lacunae TaxID=2801331 RepID=A0ABS1KWY3_9BACT|nr:hypothetical protein [Chryseolinea lacunae]MBL0743884.1 hypothetical protein [Chryseolinea lacunae]